RLPAPRRSGRPAVPHGASPRSAREDARLAERAVGNRLRLVGLTAVPDRRLQDAPDPREPPGAVRLSAAHGQGEEADPRRELGASLRRQDEGGALQRAVGSAGAAPGRAGWGARRTRSPGARSADAAWVPRAHARRVASAGVAPSIVSLMPMRGAAGAGAPRG